MAEFTEVMKQRERMCKSMNYGCSLNHCPLSSGCNGRNLSCSNFIRIHPKEAEEIIMAWAKEHPIKTNEDKFREVFGFIPDSEYCPNKCQGNGCINCEHRHFWSQEYKEPMKGE